MSATIAILGIVTNGSSFSAGSQTADTTKAMITMYGTITLSGSYPAHGDPLNFTGLSSEFSYGNQAPTWVNIKELVVAGGTPAGFIYNYNPGPTLAAPTQAGGVLQILGTGTASQDGLNELVAGTYAGQTPSLNGTVLWFEAKFSRL